MQMGLQRWWEQEIPVDGAINKGELMTHNLTELIKPESYEVRLTPITRFGEGDSTIRIVTYSGECYQPSFRRTVISLLLPLDCNVPTYGLESKTRQGRRRFT